MIDYFDKINRHKYLQLAEIGEPADNSLFLRFEEAIPSGIKEDIEILGMTVKDTQSIITSEDCAAYEVLFDDYITYCVTNESFTVGTDNEKFIGKLFRIYSESNFLEYISKTFFVTNEYPGPYKHYCFDCLNHVIDVVSVSEPKIEQIRGIF